VTIIFDTFSPKRAAELSGIGSVAMLDYLQRTGVFFPKGRKGQRGRGKQRRYDFRDVLTLKAIRGLLDAGASVSALKKALENFSRYAWSADPATMEDRNGAIKYFIVVGERIFLEKDAQILLDLSRDGQLAFSFILDLDRLHVELCKAIGYQTPQSELSL